MKIKEKLKTEVKKANMTAAISGVALATAFFGGQIFPTIGPLFGIIGFLGFLGFGIGVLSIMFFIKCPRCNQSFGEAANSFRELNFCGKCGVDLNEDV